MNDPALSEYLIQRMIAEAKAPQRRKVIQIAVAAAALSGSDILYVLYDDGTLWWTAPQVANNTWIRVKDNPNECLG